MCVGWPRAGTLSVDLTEVHDADERLGIMDDATRLGVVLLQLSGHIMLYLGRDREGTPRVLHVFAEYVEPCAGGVGETLRTVSRVSVSDLSLGAGSSRGSLLERITRVTVIGHAPP